MKTPPPDRKISLPPCHRPVTATLLIVFSFVPSSLLAQSIAPDSTLPGGVMSSLNTNGSRVDITGGIAIGSNLFHSFSDFQVSNGSTANFLSQGAENILSRVTGSNPSNISGTIGVDIGQVNRSNANLFFLNPNGVVFGSTASLDLNGSFHVSTADSIRLGTDPGAGLFSASDPLADLLTSAPPSAFGFTGSNPMGISLERSALSVQPGKVISIIGGDPDGLPQAGQLTDENPGVRISDSTISAPQGQINLVSVAGPGTVSSTGPAFTSAVSLTDVTELGTIDITNDSGVDVTGSGGGTIAIRGGRLTLNNRARVSANTLSSGKAGTILVTAQTVDVTDGGQISTSSESTGAAGTILVTATGGEVTLSGHDSQTSSGTNAETDFVSGLFANTLGTGMAGTITVQSKNLNITDGARIATNTFGRGNGNAGAIVIEATGEVILAGADANRRSLSGIEAGAKSLPTPEEGLLGSGGQITIIGKTVQILDGAQIDARSLGQNQSDIPPSTNLPSAGTVNIQADTVEVAGALRTENNILLPSNINTGATGPASTGDIVMDTNNITIRDGGVISAETESGTNTGRSGGITLRAKENVRVSGAAFNPESPQSPSLSRIRARTSGGNQSGDITLSAKNLTITGGAQITNGVLSEGEGSGGELAIAVTDTVRIEGAYEFVDQSGASVRSNISSSTEGPGKGGKVSISAKNVELIDGGLIGSSTIGRGSGDAGEVIIDATENVILRGKTSLIDQQPDKTSKTQEITSRIFTGSFTPSSDSNQNLLRGNGGDITVRGKMVRVEDGATIRATSTGNEGEATQALKEKIINLQEADRPRGGNIIIDAESLTVTGARTVGGDKNFSLFPSEIGTGVNGPAGTGNITLNANNIAIRDGASVGSETESRTPGVQRGNIRITANETLEISGVATRSDFPENPLQKDPRPENSATGLTVQPSSLVARTSGTNQGGDIEVSAKNFVLTNGGRIANDSLAQSENAGSAGKILIAADNALNISGVAPVVSNAGDALLSIIGSRTVGPGDAGQIEITSKTIDLLSGGRISASSIPGQNAVGAGVGGTIQVMASDSVHINGAGVEPGTGAIFPSGLFSITEGAAEGGTISISSPSIIEINNGATISTSATDLGEAGEITLKAKNEILLDGATLSTKATQSSGGNIKLDASDLIFVKDSLIESSVEGDGTTQGGNISLDPVFIVLLNSQIFAKAADGAGGNITLVSDVIFQDTLNDISASAGPAGVSGTVNIQAPIQNLSQAIAPLPETIIEVAALYNAQCAGQKNGQFSSFTQQGLDRIPYEPGELLPTPLFIPDLTLDQSKKKNMSSSPIVQRLKIPGFDSATSFVSTWDISRRGCRS